MFTGTEPAMTANPPKRSVVIGGVAVQSISKHLYTSSRFAARTALATYKSENLSDRRVAAVEAGSALEYLGRSILAAHDPALLALGMHVPSRLALSNVPSRNSPGLNELRTIPAAEVFLMLTAVSPSLAKMKSDYDFVMGVRNASAHMALTDPETLEQSVLKLVRLVGEFHSNLHRPEDEYWGDEHWALAKSLKDEYANEVKSRVAQLLFDAKTRMANLAKSIAAESFDAAVELLQRSVRPSPFLDDTVEEEIECPACNSRGTLVMLEEVLHEQARLHEERTSPCDFDAWVETPVVGRPTFFYCPVCQLELEDEELDEFDNLSKMRGLEPRTGDPADHYEPDDDYY